MPRLTSLLPKYRKHASGQARVTINGRDYLLGPHGTRASKLEYDRVIAEYLASGRSGSFGLSQGSHSLTMVMVDYLAYAKSYYGTDPSSEWHRIKYALSDTSSVGFDQRLARFGDQLCTVLTEMKKGTPSLDALSQTRDLLLAYNRGARERRRVDRAQMALRLVRWLLKCESSKESTEPGSLADASLIHLHEGGYVDWARLTLRSCRAATGRAQ